MRSSRMICLLLAVAGAVSGCSQLAGSGKKAGSATPAEAVHTFLTAICSADEPVMFALLTGEARTALKSHNMSPQLPSSGSTSFEIVAVEMVDGGAHVMTNWSTGWKTAPATRPTCSGCSGKSKGGARGRHGHASVRRPTCRDPQLLKIQTT